jgi:hypothetical protein
VLDADSDDMKKEFAALRDHTKQHLQRIEERLKLAQKRRV